jgi:hypothetical protein
MNFKVFLFLSSLVISLSFFVLQDHLVRLTNIEISRQIGQLNEQGMYDLGDYTGPVHNLIHSKSLKFDKGILHRAPPGYPLLLYSLSIISRIFNVELPYALFLFAAFFIACTTVIIGCIVYLFYESKKFAVIGGLLYATHPYILQGITKVMSLTPFMTFFYLSLFVYFYFLLRRPATIIYPIVIGFLLGISMLIHPISLLLPLILATLIFVYMKDLKFFKKFIIFSMIILSSLLTILPWQLFNYFNGEKIILSTHGLHTIIDGVTINNSEKKYYLDLPADVDALAKRLSTSQTASMPDYFRLTYFEFLNSPVTVLKLLTIKAARSWYGVVSQDAKKELMKLLILGLYAILFCLALLKIDFRKKEWFVLGMTSAVLIFYFWTANIIGVSIARYMYPIFGLATVFIPAIWYKQ